MKLGKRVLLGILATLMAVSLVSCLSLAPLSAAETEEKYRFDILFHAMNHPFCGPIIRGVEEAGEALGVDARFIGPAERVSFKEMMDLLEVSIAAEPDGIAIPFLNPTAMDEPIRRAMAKGIPIIAVNVEDTRPPEERIPYLSYIGEPSELAGENLARRVLEDFTPKRVLILVPDPFNIVFTLRHTGIERVFAAAGVPVEKLDTGEVPAQVISAVKSYLVRNPETDLFVGLSQIPANIMDTMIREEGYIGEKFIATFDFNPKVLDSIDEGITICAMDQQQYLQGFMPVVYLYLYKKYGFLPPAVVGTGESYIDRETTGLAREMSERQYR